MAATNISSKQVGGDYYDLIRIDDHRFVIAIGDVSGKGTPASLLMANLQATIRALVPLDLPLGELTGRVNDLICENTGSDRFITFFWGILDTETRVLRYVNAGHNPPYVVRANGTFDRLDVGGLILGIMKATIPYEQGETTLCDDDLLVLFTDGVTEAMNARDEEWEEERLEAIALAHLQSPPDTILDTVVAALKEHGKDVPQSDDITMIIARALPA